MKKVFLFIGSIIGGVLYRMGGSDNYDTKARDFGVPLVAIVLMGLLYKWHWTMIPSFGLMFASLTTYFKKKGSDARWFNWLFVGLAISVSVIPYVFANELWVGFGIRTAVLTAGIVAWSELVGNAVEEELGRGFLTIITLPLLFIGKV